MCKFCGDYNFSKELDLDSKFPRSFSVAIVSWSVVDGRLKGRTVHYMEDGVGFPLNYCPECGKKLLED